MVAADLQLLVNVGASTSYRLQSIEAFEAATGTKAPTGKRYFHYQKLPDIINAYPFPHVRTSPAINSSPLPWL